MYQKAIEMNQFVPPIVPEDLLSEPLREMEIDLEVTTTTPPLTDMDAVKFIAKYVRSDDSWISYRATSSKSGEWYVWNGVVHERTKTDIDEYLATKYSDFVKAWFDRLPVPDENSPKSLKALWGKRQAAMNRWRSQSGLEALKGRLRAQFRVPADHFDKDRDITVLKDGRVMDLSDFGNLQPPSPKRPVTKHLGVTFIGEGLNDEDHDAWQEWLDQFVPDPLEQRFLQEAAGAAFLGGGNAKNIVHLVGPKNTGKSTYLNLMEAVFGAKRNSGYAGNLPAGAIIKRNSGANFDQAEAKGVRFLKMSEPPTDRTDDSFLKNLAGGGEAIVTQRKNQDPEEWLAECVFHVAANEIVRFNTTDAAIVDRVNIVEFNNVVPKVDFGFESRLIEEDGSRILLWVILGAKRYQRQGSIYVPQSVKDRGADHVVESSSALVWLKEESGLGKRYVLTTDSPKGKLAKVTDAYNEYKTWTYDNSERTLTKKAWRRAIENYTKAPRGWDEPGKVYDGYARLYGVVQLENAPLEYQKITLNSGKSTEEDIDSLVQQWAAE